MNFTIDSTHLQFISIETPNGTYSTPILTYRCTTETGWLGNPIHTIDMTFRVPAEITPTMCVPLNVEEGVQDMNL